MAESWCLDTLFPCSSLGEQSSPDQEQIRQRCQHIDLAAVLGQAAHPGFLKAELLLDHPEWVFDLGADVGLGGLDQILQPAI